MLSFEDPNALIESDRFWHVSSWSSFVSFLAAWGWWNAGLQLTLLYHTSKKDLQNENQEMCLRCQSSNAQRDDDETSDASVRIPRNVHLKNHRFRIKYCLRSLSGAKTRHPALHRCEMYWNVYNRNKKNNVWLSHTKAIVLPRSSWCVFLFEPKQQTLDSVM